MEEAPVITDGLVQEVVLTEAEQKAKDEKEMQDFIDSPENKQHAIVLAQQIVDVTRGKWFTVDQLAAKIKLNRFATFQKIEMCKLFGHTVERVGTADDGPNKKGEKLFKINISIDDKIQALDDIISYINGELKSFELQKKILLDEKTKQTKI